MIFVVAAGAGKSILWYNHVFAFYLQKLISAIAQFLDHPGYP